MLTSYGLWTPEQAYALADLVREHAPSHVYVAKGPKGLYVDMYGDENVDWGLTLTISLDGTVREDKS